MIGRVARQLKSTLPGGLYQYPQGVALQSLYETAKTARWTFHYLDGLAIPNKAIFLNHAGQIFQFPTYAGQNWDAFEELMRDLSWLPQTGRLLVFDQPIWIVRRQPATWRMARSILEEVTEYWSQTPTPLLVLLRNAGRAGQCIPWL